MKKLLSALLCCILLLSLYTVHAEPVSDDTICTYRIPEGAVLCYVTETDQLPLPPSGLEKMYALMLDAKSNDDLYYLCPKNGYMLVTISSAAPAESFSSEAMLDRKAEILTAVQSNDVTVNLEDSSLCRMTIFGYDALYLDLVLEQNDSCRLNAECVLFQTDKDLIEMWVISPDASIYPDDSHEALALAEDAKAVGDFLSSLDFGRGEGTQAVASTTLSVYPSEILADIQTVPYVSPEQWFSMEIPQDAVVMDTSSAAEQREAMRTKFEEVHGSGSETMFDQFLKDVDEEKAVVVFSGEYQVVLELFCEENPSFSGYTPQMFTATGPYICENLNQQYGYALLLGSSTDPVISELTHGETNYWVRCGDVNFQLDVLAAVSGESCLREVDIFSFPLSPYASLRTVYYTLVLTTLQYLPPQ